MQSQTKENNGEANQQVSAKDVMGSEGDLEAKVVGPVMQVSVKDGMGGERDLEARVVG